MDGDDAHKLLADWMAKGLLRPDRLLKSLDEDIENGIFSSEERRNLRHHFKSHGNKAGAEEILTEVTLTTLLKSLLVDFAHFELLEKAGSILFRSLVYLSSYPFPSKADYLTYEGLARALLLALPSRARKFMGSCSFNRARTMSDERRLIFQSLASSKGGKDLPYDQEVWKENSRRRAFENFAEGFTTGYDGASSNNDQDGDEIYHDMLDFLFGAQPIKKQYLARVTRQSFRGVGKDLHHSVPLHWLMIPQEDFCILVQLLLCYQFRDSRPCFSNQSKELEVSSKNIVRAFEQNLGGINWEAFESTVTTVVVSGCSKLVCITR
jgi:hypothetical protein